MAKAARLVTSSMQREFRFPKFTGKVFHKGDLYPYEEWMEQYPQYFKIEQDDVEEVPEPPKEVVEALDKKIAEEVEEAIKAEETINEEDVDDEEVDGEETTEDDEGENEPVEEEEEPKTEAVGFKAVHKGFGKWVIEDEEGNQVAPEEGEHFKKAEAFEILETMI